MPDFRTPASGGFVTGADNDEDGIRDVADAAPQVFGTFVDRDGDGMSDLLEAGGADANGDGVVDNFVDVNGNGLSDSFESSLGGHALPLPDTDADGTDNHRDLDSDGDGISDVIESGGADANTDGRQDGVDSDHDGLADSADNTLGGHVPARPDTDGDGMNDSLDLDSDNDAIPDRSEGRGDFDGDGIPDSIDKQGSLQTAVRGAGAFDPLSLLGMLALIAWAAMRRAGRKAVAHALPVLMVAAVFAPGQASAADTVSKGWYVGFDTGMSLVEPRESWVAQGEVVSYDADELFFTVGVRKLF